MTGAFLTLLLLGLTPAPALAQGPVSDPAPLAGAPRSARASAAALSASEVLDAHCADVAAGRATESAQAAAAVSAVLSEASAAHDATGEAYLLFWRGRLNLCLDREDRAREDLEAFAAQTDDDPAYAPQLAQARAHLRRLARAERPRPTILTPGVAVVGGVLLAGSGALAGLGAWQWTVAEDGARQYLEGQRLYAESQSIAESANAAQTASGVLVGSALASGVGGALSIVLSTLAPRSKAAPVSLAASPTADGGFVLVAGGAW